MSKAGRDIRSAEIAAGWPRYFNWAIKSANVTNGREKFGKVMGEFKEGTLHSGSKTGPTVTSKEQAMAIAASESGMGKKKKKKKGY